MNQDIRKSERGRESGFSAIELIIVAGIILVLSAAAMIQINGALTLARRDAALTTVVTQMRNAHEIAIDQRKVYRLTFTAPDTIQLDLQVLTQPGNIKTYTFVSSMQLPTGYQFTTVAGQPTAAGTTPDGFGAGVTAVDFSVNNGGGLNQVFFQPNGSALDNVGRLNNGVVYVGKPGELPSLRAVSMYGAAARMKPWVLTQVGGVYTWQAR